MTWREKALAVIHLEFTTRRKANPHRRVAEIMKEIKPPWSTSGNNFPTKVWRDALRDYQRDAQKMYEQKGSKN